MKKITLLAFLSIFLLIGLASPALAADITGERTLNTTNMKAGENFRVTLNVTVSDGTLYAPGIDENLPDGWTATPVQNNGMIYQAANTQWVLIDEMGPGKKTVIYDVFVPATTKNGTYSITGEVSAKEWADGEEIKRQNNITGDTNVTIGVPDIYKPIPVAAFNADITNGFASLTVNFTDQSTGKPTSWIWDFGDGNNATEQNPVHTYTKAGNYSVNLTVSNENGTNSTSALIIVSEKTAAILPVANFSSNVSKGYAPLSVQFTDLSENATEWEWDFGDGNSSTEQNPVHTYTSAGNYTVNLTVSNAEGSDSEEKTDYIVVSEHLSGAPVANFMATPTSGSAPLTVNFTDASTGTISSYAWDFDNDGNVDSTEQNPSYTYDKVGTYTVNLTVSNADRNDSEVKNGYIKVSSPSSAKPVAEFSASPTSGKTPLKVKFTDTSTGSPTSWFWNFGDGSKSFHQNPIHKYSKAGVYTVNLTVKNAKGRNTITKTEYIKVITKPAANFSANPTSGKTPLKVKFTDTSTGIPAKWIWDFGDGSKSFHQNPIHKYSKAGTYTVNLTVKNAKGKNTVTKTEYIKVITKPVANFTSSVTSGKTPLKVKFTDTSTGIPAKWIWDFGDGSKSFHQNPIHKYSNAGTYTVNLTVKNAVGRNTVTKTEYIKVT